MDLMLPWTEVHELSGNDNFAKERTTHTHIQMVNMRILILIV